VKSIFTAETRRRRGKEFQTQNPDNSDRARDEPGFKLLAFYEGFSASLRLCGEFFFKTSVN
jgi:hypothetical protein